MKIGTRLYLGFGSVLLVLIASGIFNYFNFSKIDDAIQYVIDDQYVKVQKVNSITKNIGLNFMLTRDMILVTDNAKLATIRGKIDESTKAITEAYTHLDTTMKNPKGRQILAAYVEIRKRYLDARVKMLKLADQNKNEEALSILYNTIEPIQNEYFTALNKLNAQINFRMNEEVTKMKDEASSGINMIIILLIIGIIVAMFIAWLVAKAITKPINQAVEAANGIAEGNFNVNLETNKKDETGILINSLKAMATNVGDMVADVNHLAQDASNGKLDKRADSGKYKGEYKQLVEAINGTLDAVINPLNMTAEYVDRISKGDMPSMITDDYKGDFNEIKNNINQCITAIQLLISDTKGLASAASMGNLSFRADETRHGGDFRNIISGINNAIDSIASPLLLAANNMDRISKGDMPSLITDEYKGDFNIVKLSTNQLIENVTTIITGINRITVSMQNGKLDDRAHVDMFQGDWAKLVGGINNIIDSLMTPLMITVDYLQKLAKGDIPEGINAEYHGDYNKIKDSVNTLIAALNNATEIAEQISKGNMNNEIKLRSKDDKLMIALETMTNAIKNLVEDAEYLAKSAVNGEMSVRADETRHYGDFRAIVAGVNQTLDSVMAPVNESVEILKGMANGDLSHSMIGDYQGDHAILKNSLNQTIDSLNVLLSQVLTTVEEVTRGSVQVSDASNALSQGATEQAASLEEITSSMSQVGAQTRTNAENANRANSLAFEAKESADRGNSEMDQLNKAMEDISDSSKNISKIIKVIDEIAFQTNLLALNAAVEAARAGRHGKGFAVVAEEVRNLAARSASAAKETSELIENSIRTVENGSILASRTAVSLDEIRNGSVKSADLVGEIATSSNEQAQAIAQINEGLSQIDKVTQTNTASAEESASAAEELSGQATMLKNMLSSFKLKDEYSYNSDENIHQLSGRSLRRTHALESSQANVGQYESVSSRKDLVPEDVISLDDDDFGRY